MSEKKIEITWPDGSKTIENHDFLTRPLTDEEKESLEESRQFYLEHEHDGDKPTKIMDGESHR